MKSDFGRYGQSQHFKGEISHNYHQGETLFTLDPKITPRVK
jgi:hypothetical protein